MRMKFLAAISKPLALAMLAVLLAPGAWAAGKGKAYAFKGPPDGQQPNSGLVEDGAGNFYGVTSVGGVNGFGAVFQLSPTSGGSWTESIIFNDFTSSNGGGYLPVGNLVLDGAGNLYGATSGGGSPSCNCGTVFELVHGQTGWSLKTLYAFQGDLDGRIPRQGVVFDSRGNLYGTTEFAGGSNCNGVGCGTVFELTPNQDGSWTESTVYDFQGGEDGSYPNSLVFDAAGNLYGTTGSGGSIMWCSGYGCGTVFELTEGVDGWAESILYKFTDGLDGGYPSGNVIFDDEGNLYGEAGSGGSFSCPGSGCGLIFKLTPVGGGLWEESSAHTFRGLDGKGGWGPGGGLTFDSAGNIYGTTGSGGDGGCGGFGCGTIFKLAPSGNGSFLFSILAEFDNTHGAYPAWGVTVDAQGHLYGTASNGGDLKCNEPTGCGTAFELTP